MRARPMLPWPRWSRRALVVWRRNATAWRRFLPTSILANLTQPLLTLLALGLGLGAFVREVGGMSLVEFIGPALVVAGAMLWVTFDAAYGVYERLHWTRAYHAMIASPLSVEELAAGEILWQASRTFLFASGFVVLLVPFGAVRSPWALAIPAVAALTGLIYAGPAIAVAALARTEEQLSYYFNLAVQPMFFLAGVFFPLEALGEPFRATAAAVPLYHAVELARVLAQGDVSPGAVEHLAGLGLFAVASLLLPVPFLRRALERIP